MAEIIKNSARTQFNKVTNNGDGDETIVRRIVQSVSRGNVNLQLGRYITEQDKDILREKMRNYVIKGVVLKCE